MMLLMSISCILIPYSNHLWHLYLLVCIYGFGAGNWSNANYVWLIEFWQHNSPPILQLSGFMYGIGIILGSIIQKSYLSYEPQYKSNISETYISNSTALQNNNSTFLMQNIDRRSELKSVFLIIGIIHTIGI